MKIPQTKKYSIYRNLVLQDERSTKLDFTLDGRKHYVYRVTDIETEEYYIGSRTKVKENIYDDFWSYCTSSKRKKMIGDKKEKYKLKITKVFDNAGDKILYESFLHQYFDVKSHKSFWNESNQTPFGFNTTGMKFIFDKKHKEKIGKNFRIWCNTKNILPDGTISTNAIERNKKSEITRNKKIIMEGYETSIAKLSAIQQKETKKKNGKWYVLKNIFNNIEEKISAVNLRCLSQTLHLKTRDNYLGYSRESKLNLNRNNKLNLIGSYVEEIK